MTGTKLWGKCLDSDTKKMLDAGCWLLTAGGLEQVGGRKIKAAHILFLLLHPLVHCVKRPVSLDPRHPNPHAMAAVHEDKETYTTHDESDNGASHPSPPLHEDFDAHEEKKLMRKIDIRLLPILGALYSIALIDRVNVSHPSLARFRSVPCFGSTDKPRSRSPTPGLPAWGRI